MFEDVHVDSPDSIVPFLDEFATATPSQKEDRQEDTAIPFGWAMSHFNESIQPQGSFYQSKYNPRVLVRVDGK